MSATTCCFDGRPFGKLEREFVCINCAMKVCAEHSTDDRMNPFTGEKGRACRRCLAESIEATVEAQVAWLYRQIKAWGPELKTLVDEVQALRLEVGLLRKTKRPSKGASERATTSTAPARKRAPNKS